MSVRDIIQSAAGYVYPAPPLTSAQLYLTSSTLSGLANNTVVTSWTNQGASGFLYNASAASNGPFKTTLNGFPVLRFQTTTYLSMTLASDLNLTTGSLFMVGYQLSTRLVVLGGATPNGNCFFGYSGDAGTAVLLRDKTDDGLTKSGLVGVDGLKAFGIVKNGTTGLTLFDNSTTPIVESGLSGTFIFKKIGARDYSGISNKQPSDGYIADILYFNSALSNLDAAGVIATLKNKYSIA